jgi:putative transposase
MPYWSLYYHVVWATKHRHPVVSDLLIDPIVNAITHTAQESGVVVHAVGVMPDHIHVLAEVPPSIALATIIGQWKGASSHAANAYGPAAPTKITWQSGYGVHSVSARNVEPVREYVLHQRQRHAARGVYGAYERTEDDEAGRDRAAWGSKPQETSRKPTERG